MEEETADRLYRHFQTVDRNARQRRVRSDTSPACEMNGSFVKANERN